MPEIDTGGRASPTFRAMKFSNSAGTTKYDLVQDEPGMNLLDHFAGIAFQEFVKAHIESSIDDLSKDIIARESYSYATAMIAEKRRLEGE